ncbi:TIGR02710 family CRISPR-associated CARF protein [uncultured Methanobrevibacter sp.]|uniref:TIGR02710 family CRISPR-associated CARF protein n=1 Tax=uncultured Methanobrevibacter sp. TaxID=253161 RepID=UPI0026DFD8A1|nr:TIGR02710 family CRISPR-associated CARF protein [uncultured Methanobrevibacter sp.]
MSKAIIFTVGSHTSMIPTIKEENPDFCYFIHSDESKEKVDGIIKEMNFDDSDFKSIKVQHQNLDDIFVKSKMVIDNANDNFSEIMVDYTGGTKVMSVGLALAASIYGVEVKYGYIDGKRDNRGSVISGDESLRTSSNPYDYYAIKEMNSAKEFFNKYQFEAAEESFENAYDKLKSEALKKQCNIYLKITKLYRNWDKFNDNVGDKKLNKYLSDEILDMDEGIKKNLTSNDISLLNKLEDNSEFLKQKIKSKLNSKNVKYYLADLINNAERRIDESKFDDAVARLYRAMELISQIGLLNKNLLDENELKNKIFKPDDDKVAEIDDLDIKNRLDTRSGLRNNFTVLEKLGVDYAKEYMQNDEFQKRIEKRNKSILAHGLNPIDKGDAKMLHDLVLDYAHKLYPKIDEYKDMAEFPKFNIDS